MAHSVVHLQKPYTIIKEMEFEGACSKKMDANPVAVVEAFIHINNQLHQHEYEKLQRWDHALKAYTAKASQATSPHLNDNRGKDCRSREKIVVQGRLESFNV
ncbi:hypothetical protein JHK82_024382 [Glycine max]|nr:hypothetical protein JHK82_024382 [Glycine max]